MKTHILLLPCPTHFMIWRAWLELLNKATLRKSLEKWPKIVENGQNRKPRPIEIMEISCQKRVIVLSCDRFEWRHTIVLIKKENKKYSFMQK